MNANATFMRSCIFISLLLISFSLTLRGQNFTASVSKTTLALNDILEVYFRIENGQSRDIQYPSFEGFQIVGGPNASTSMQIVNGQVSQSNTYSFYLQPKSEGTFTIGPATAKINGKTYTTKPIQVKVVKAAAHAPSESGETANGASADIMEEIRKNVFLRTLASKTTVYQGEPITLTYKLYTRAQMSNPYLTESPSYKGFWVEELEVNDPPKTEVYNGLDYRTNVIKRVILFPQQSGKLRVEPIELETNVRVMVQSQNRRRRSIFDDFFGQYQDVPYTFASNPLNIEVKPLPAGRPAGFSGAVGDFQLDVSLDKTATETGEPVTMKVKISGAGNFKMLSPPALEFPPDFDVFDPSTDERVARTAAGLKGYISYDYLIVPRNPGEYKLPVVQFSYFDPAKGRYITRSSDEFVLRVTGEARQSSAALTHINKEDIELIGEDIRYLKSDMGSLEDRGSSFVRTPLFWLLYLLPFGLFALLWVVKQRRDKQLQDVAGMRSRKAQKLAKKRLAQALVHKNEQNEQAFYDEIVRAIWGYLADKLNIGQSELLREHIRARLADRGIAPEIIERCMSLLDKCEMALFAPSASEGGMDQTYQEAMQLIVDMEAPLKEHGQAA